MMSALPETLSPLGEAALAYARRGWHVFRLAAGTKEPIKGSHGFKDATTEEAKIRLWWLNMRDANIGIACGASGLVVVDVDRHKSDGFASLAEFERTHGGLPPTLTSFTPNDGEHRVYLAPDFVTIKNSAADDIALAGIDIRGTDGYIVAPPSVINGRVYRWKDGVEPAEFPLQLATAICGVAGRNNYLAKVIAPRARNMGMSGDGLLEALQRVNAKFVEPLPGSEMRKIADSADRNYDAYEPQLTRTDEANGQRLYRQFGSDMRWVWERKCFYIWNGHRWVADKSGQCAMSMAKRGLSCILDELKAERMSDADRKKLLDHATKSKNVGAVENALEMLKSEPDITRNATDFDLGPMLLGVRNGTIDLRTGEFYQGRREDLISLSAGCAYDASALCPLFDQFLLEICSGDAHTVEWLWRCIGYLLTGRCDDQMFLFLWGAGSNGKGVLCSTLVALLGDYAETMSTAVVIEGGKPFANANTPEIAKLLRKRMVLVPEVPEGARLNGAQVKNLTGGDHITGTAKFEHPITFAPTHKFVMYGNHEPALNSEDYGIVRRAMMVPFTQRYMLGTSRVPDPQLADKLLAELPGILNRAIAGCLAWQQRSTHVDKPRTITEKTEEWLSDQPTFNDFLNDCCVIGEKLYSTRATLFKAYTDWRKGQSGAGLQPGEFKGKLAALPGIKVDADRRVDGKPRKVVTGICVRPGWNDEAAAAPSQTEF